MNRTTSRPTVKNPPDSTNEEGTFLGQLPTKFLSNGVWNRLHQSSRERTAQVGALVIIHAVRWVRLLLWNRPGFQQPRGETMTDDGRRRVLWLTPDKPANISVGRRRITEQLREDGLDVTLRGTTPQTVLESVRERNRYDVVIGTTRSGALTGILLNLLGTPLVVDHIDPIRQLTETHPRLLSLAVRLGENVSFVLADHVLYVYDEERDRVMRYATATTQTDLGVAYDNFVNPTPEAIEQARDRLAAAGVGTDERIVIYVGGLEPIYRIPELLAAMDHLDGWKLVVLGTGAQEGDVERAARERDDTVFLGIVEHEEVPGYVHAADVGVSLVDDPHTLKVLEYAAAGLGVVQARGRAEDRFGGYGEFCDPIPRDVARAVQRAGESGASETFREYVREFDYERVTTAYRRGLEGVGIPSTLSGTHST